MPRPRSQPSKQRDFAAEYRRRQERAKAAGFGSYYEQRTAGVPKGERSTARGHGLPKGFLRSLGPGDMIILADPISAVELYDGYRWTTGEDGTRKRQPVERFRLVKKLVIYALSGREKRWNLRRLSREEMRAVIREEERRGAVFSPSPSLDQRRLLRVGEHEEEDDE